MSRSVAIGLLAAAGALVLVTYGDPGGDAEPVPVDAGWGAPIYPGAEFLEEDKGPRRVVFVEGGRDYSVYNQEYSSGDDYEAVSAWYEERLGAPNTWSSEGEEPQYAGFRVEDGEKRRTFVRVTDHGEVTMITFTKYTYMHDP